MLKQKKYIVTWGNYTLLCLLIVFSSLNLVAEEAYSPAVNSDHPTTVYWGDTHLHTNLSMDANGWGNNKLLSPDDAYRFARGETITTETGRPVKLSRPLDFIALADHIESLSVILDLESSTPALLSTEVGQALHQRWQAAKNESASSQEAFKATSDIALDIFTNNLANDALSYKQSVWDKVSVSADRNNRPGIFTAFIGYEWTSMGYGFDWDPKKIAGNLHRVVIFKDAADKTTALLPFTAYQSDKPENLWAYMERYNKETGGDVLAIPHNGNLSVAGMFSLVDVPNGVMDFNYAKTRSRWEPLYEVTQIKGDGEASPLLSPDDEFADFEIWEDWNGRFDNNSPLEQEREQHPFEYARSALKLGLSQQAALGVNPFKFGMIGSTDSHTSLASAEEDNFWGKFSLNEPAASRILAPQLHNWTAAGWESASGGYAAIWAEENTRESLFTAMQRKEVYATTGPRMTVRFFGGWDYKKDDAYRPDLARIGYAKGVPMGGDLTSAPKDKAPTFLIRSVKDPDGANLDRVQVLKGWHDANGELHEKIYNVALSDNRKDKGQKTKKVGNTVDIPDASYTNTIGDPELAVVWKDPDFDKDELAFYYVRVLKIPTPRWTAYDAKYFELKDIPEEIPMITQERAYSSPIWYTP